MSGEPDWDRIRRAYGEYSAIELEVVIGEEMAEYGLFRLEDPKDTFRRRQLMHIYNLLSAADDMLRAVLAGVAPPEIPVARSPKACTYYGCPYPLNPDYDHNHPAD